MPTSIRDSLELILAGYADARANEPFGREHELWIVFDELKQDFSERTPLRRRPTLRVRWSAGQGNWAKVPWIAFLDERDGDYPARRVLRIPLPTRHVGRIPHFQPGRY